MGITFVKGERYAKQCSPEFVKFVTKRLPFLSFTAAAVEFYNRIDFFDLEDHELAFLGCNDRFFLLTVLCDRKDGFNEWVYDRSREVERSPDDHLDLWARYHYKSSIITFAGSIQEIVSDPEITIGIFSNTQDVASPFLSQIMEELETNELLKRVYADVLWQDPRKEAPVWSRKDGIVVKRLGNPKEATVNAHGIMEALPTGLHYKLRIYNDIVTEKSVSDTATNQMGKTTRRWEMSQNLGTHEGGRKWHEGTRYHFCTIGSMRITMADWTQKPIEDVRVGDMVVGWELRDGKRWLKPVRVLNRGAHKNQPVRKFTFQNKRSVIATADHKWWSGPHGSGEEYQPLSMPGVTRRAKGPPRGSQATIRELLIPMEKDDGRDAAWLAGFFDGEGTVRKNTYHPSGVIGIVQTTHNLDLIWQAQRALQRLGFDYSSAWHQPKNPKWSARCTLLINGGWRERYRFIAQVAPYRRDAIAKSLFGQLQTHKIGLTNDEDAGRSDVHWLTTESGNYIVEGYCSSNSDTYGVLIERRSLTPRVYAATEDGKLSGTPVFLAPAAWETIKRDQRSTVAAQMLLNPLAGEENTFVVEWLRPYALLPRNLTIYILGDPSKGKNKKSDRTALMVIGMDATRNLYLLDGYCHRMRLSQRWQALKDLFFKWKKAPGVSMVRIGYERYGLQSDEEYFDLEMQREQIEGMAIDEVNWVGEGSQAKPARIGRLEPFFRNSRFWMPPKVWHPEVNTAGGVCTWTVDAEKQEVVYRPYIGPSRAERDAVARGEHFRIVQPLRRLDQDGNVYDVFRAFYEEYRTHPFSAHDDVLDATSRIVDMDPVPPMLHERFEAESRVEHPD